MRSESDGDVELVEDLDYTDGLDPPEDLQVEIFLSVHILDRNSL